MICTLLLYVQAGSRKKPQFYSPANVHAVFSIQPEAVNFCTRIICMCHCENLKPHTVIFFLFIFVFFFSGLQEFLENVAHTLDQKFSAKNKEEKTRSSGLGMGT